MTREIYDQVYREMHREGPPDGGLFHLAGPTQHGWRVVEVWESQEAFDVYERTLLQPLLRRHGAAPAELSRWTVHRMEVVAAATVQPV